MYGRRPTIHVGHTRALENIARRLSSPKIYVLLRRGARKRNAASDIEYKADDGTGEFFLRLAYEVNENLFSA